ncbi:MAG: sigma-70 family RNA polymerase sigma factor [Gemmatimonadetes bacterium]|nr:sigma-70 family RNA polymerase sigma factor [Gemmatimonadota bacterium]
MIGQVVVAAVRHRPRTGSAATSWPTSGGTSGVFSSGTRRKAGGPLTRNPPEAALPGDAIDEATLRAWRLALLRYVHRLTGNPDLAEDVAQESLVRLLRTARSEVRSPKAWLFRVAANLVRDQARRAATAQRPIPIDVRPEDRPDLDYERTERIARVRAVLDRLSPRDREILMMRESGFPYSEIAEVIGVRTESVATLVLRALKRFRRAFENQERADASA